MTRGEGEEFAEGIEAEEGNGCGSPRPESIRSEQAKPTLEGSPRLTGSYPIRVSGALASAA
jgi:hypothetical protein